ncbi:MAG: formylglycine-generating enzyme family protein [Thiofilum sp.]|uniref:formylglycine-generating enzyme family protein n=1 Tax=Thiofilum sp. TaxID=2212733 RepID=UPI0025DC4A70|nr:formylglycine-generating enzyme family protein [Thiofilum sp.]MBK8454780.1 formylglycine-generating enzyme family protein [Thiofilum sp.]
MKSTPHDPAPSDPQPPSDWEAIVAGKLLPAPDNPEHLEADAVRQVLLWRHAKTTAVVVSAQEAEGFYQQLQLTKRSNAWQGWGQRLIWGVGLVLLGFGAGYGLVKWSTTPLVKTSEQPTTNTPLTLPDLDHITHQVTQPATLSDLPTLVVLPAGRFSMGCSAGWDDELGGCRDNEFPAHRVQIDSFELGKYEITVGQFKRFVDETQYKTTAEQTGEGCTVADPKMAGRWILHPASHWRSPGFAQTDVHPVVCISWDDTQHYIAWLNKTTGQTYRLPTEEEWEYAARGGKVTAFFWGSQPSRNFANYQGQGELDQWQYTAPVGQFSSNAYGLHDMSGNAWEWVQTCWRDNYDAVAASTCDQRLRARRGGAWDNQPPSLRSAYRSQGHELERSFLYGFRVARSLR